MAGTTVPIRPLLQVNFGSTANATDDTLGKVAQVLVHPETWAISYIVVQRGLVMKKLLTLPVDFIREARVDGLQFSLPVDDLVQKAQTPKEPLLTLREHLPISYGSETLGGLSQLFFDAATRRIAYLVVHRQTIAGSEVLLSVDQLVGLQAGRLEVNIAPKEFALLPLYRPDPQLEEDVRQALWDYPRLRIDLGAIKIHAQCNEVWLQGYVSSGLNRRVIEDQLSLVPGIRHLHNQLIADSDLAVEIAAALAKHEETRGLPIGVYPDLGEVCLRGLVPNEHVKEIAEQVAAEVPNVKAVHNELVISDRLDFLPTLAGVNGTEDVVPGGEGIKSTHSA